jgi:hypothetical protein
MPDRPRKSDLPGVDATGLKRIKKEYVANKRLLQEIAAEYGVSWQAISMRARLEGWPLRNGSAGAPPVMPPREIDERGDLVTPKQLGLRLRRIIANEIADIENRSHSEDDAEREKTVRRLASLTRSLDKLKLIKRPEQEKSGDGKTKRGDAAGGASLRAELERRLARLHAGGKEDGVSGEPVGSGDGLAS